MGDGWRRAKKNLHAVHTDFEQKQMSAEGSPDEVSHGQLRISESLRSVEYGTETFNTFIKNLKGDLKMEIERIVAEEQFIADGRAAKVFNIELQHCNLPGGVCVKIWKPELELLKNTNIIEYKKRQYLSPKEEFEFQDQLYVGDKFHKTPRVFAYVETGGHYAICMERIRGYSIGEIMDAGAKMSANLKKKFEELLIQFKNKGYVHRDLHPKNIILKTDQPLEVGAELSGELYLIDFGVAKKFYGSSPEEEDFRLTIGNDVINYPQDSKWLEEIKSTAFAR